MWMELGFAFYISQILMPFLFFLYQFNGRMAIPPYFPLPLIPPAVPPSVINTWI